MKNPRTNEKRNCIMKHMLYLECSIDVSVFLSFYYSRIFLMLVSNTKERSYIQHDTRKQEQNIPEWLTAKSAKENKSTKEKVQIQLCSQKCNGI